MEVNSEVYLQNNERTGFDQGMNSINRLKMGVGKGSAREVVIFSTF